MRSKPTLRNKPLFLLLLVMAIASPSFAVPMIGTKQLTYNPTSFQESSANNGTIDNTMPLGISLAEETFTGTNGEDFVATGKIVVSNVPSGLTVVALRSSSTQINVTLTGTAAAHTAANNVNNLTIAFQNGAFTGGSAMSVSNSNKGDLQITFLNPVVTLTAFTPVKNAVNIAAASNITLSFNEAMSSASMSLTGSIRVDGSVSGRHTGTVSYNSGTFTATIDPDVDFIAGERVSVTVTTQVTNAGSYPLASAAVWTFTVATSVTDQFVVPIRYGTGDFPIDVIATDVDGDGDNDLAVANSSSHTISVMLNTGSGTFAPKTDYASGNSPRSLSVGDLDRNGSQDIVVTNPGSNSISVLLNNGNGTFAAAVAYAAGLTADHPLIVDLNADGYLDIAATAYAENVVSIFMNNGNGTFAARVTYSSGSNTVAIASADVDGDRDLDLVIGNYEASSVSVLRNNGSGVFSAAEAYTVGTNSIHNITADVDADGDADIVVANRSSNSVTVLKNNGSGTFGSSASYATGTGPFAVAAGDVDGDGDIDLAVSSQTSNTFSILKNNGTGNFSARTDYSAPSGTLGVCLTDLNQDGAMEVITTSADVDTVSIQFGVITPSLVFSVPSANGTLTSRSANISFTFNTNMASFSFVSGSTVKVIGSQSGYHTGTIAFSNGSRTITFDPAADFSAGEDVEVVLTTGIKSADQIALPSRKYWRMTVQGIIADTLVSSGSYGVRDQPQEVALADLDGDGDRDMIVANYNARNISVLMNYGNGAFSADERYGSAAVAAYPSSVASADLDGDGDMDILVANSNYSYVSVILNNGNGTFALAVDYQTGGYPYDAVAADVDGDGDVDALVANAVGNSISVLKNNGNGTFAAKVDYAAGSSPYAIVAGDLDEDGDIDVAVASLGADAASVLLNNGDGTFSAKVEYSVGDGPYAMDVADVDGDGDLDLGLANFYSGTVSILKNNSNGTYAAKTDYVIGTHPNGVIFSDVDGDGDRDMVSTNTGGHTMVLRINNGSGIFGGAVNYATGTNPAGLASADVDNDGDVDIVVSIAGSGMVSVFKGSTFVALPVELTSFTAISRGSGVELRWNTATEVNNHGFEVERKTVSGFSVQGSGTTTSNLKPETPNLSWTRIAFVDGAGNSNTTHEYKYTDRSLSAGTYAFRLKQIDRDGKFEYSKEVEVTVASVPAKFELAQNYPNPFNPSTTIGFTLQISGMTTLKVYDAIGREVATLVNENLEAGVYHQRTFDASRFSSGIYFARLVSDNKTQIKKMSLMK